jgi:hypothetical protein
MIQVSEGETQPNYEKSTYHLKIIPHYWKVDCIPQAIDKLLYRDKGMRRLATSDTWTLKKSNCSFNESFQHRFSNWLMQKI